MHSCSRDQVQLWSCLQRCFILVHSCELTPVYTWVQRPDGKRKGLSLMLACSGWGAGRPQWRRWDALLRSAAPQSPALLRQVTLPGICSHLHCPPSPSASMLLQGFCQGCHPAQWSLTPSAFAIFVAGGGVIRCVELLNNTDSHGLKVQHGLGIPECRCTATCLRVLSGTVRQRPHASH